MKRFKTPLQSAMSDARLSLLSVIGVHKHKEIDFNEVISKFFFPRKKDSLLKLHRSQRLNYAIIYKNFTILVNLTMSDEKVPVAGAVQVAQAILQPVPSPEPGPAAAGPANPEPLQVKFL